MFDQGYTKLFSLRGIPVRAHFTIVLGFLLVSGGRYMPGTWLAYFVLLVFHEAGHAWLALRYRLRVFRIDMHMFGGVCVYEGTASAYQNSVIAWGGVLGQLLLFAVALPVAKYGPALPDVASQFVDALLGWNLRMAAFNLIPLKPLDGADAWRLPGFAYQRWQKARIRKRLVKPKAARKKQRRLEEAGEPKLRLERDEKGDFRFVREEEEKEN